MNPVATNTTEKYPPCPVVNFAILGVSPLGLHRDSATIDHNVDE